MLLWSTHPLSERKDIDEKFVQVLLLSCVPKRDLEAGEIEDDVTMFIEGTKIINFILFYPFFLFISFYSQISFAFASKMMPDDLQRCPPTKKKF